MMVRLVPSLTALAIAACTLQISVSLAQTSGDAETGDAVETGGGLSELPQVPPSVETDPEAPALPGDPALSDAGDTGGIGGLSELPQVPPSVEPNPEAPPLPDDPTSSDAGGTGGIGGLSELPQSPPATPDEKAPAAPNDAVIVAPPAPGGVGGLMDAPDVPPMPTNEAPESFSPDTTDDGIVEPSENLRDLTQEPSELREDPDADRVDDRINQTLKDAGAVLPEEVDAAYGAFQRGYFLTALAIAIEKAKEGDIAAQTLLGELLSRGLGIKADLEEAAGWYSLAADAGDNQAQYALGLLYLDGRGVEQDVQKAADLFKQAGENGNMVALRELAFLLLQGEELERRPMLAAAYLRRAAGANDGDAQFALAGLYTEGVGVAQSDVEAARWYGEAARTGHIPGQIEYAIMLFNGRGLTKDEGRAAGWFSQAARAGNPVAQVRLARLFVEGRGVEKDEREAARWYLIATRSGIKDDFMENWLLSLDADVRQSVEDELNVEAWPSRPAPEPGEDPTPADAAGEDGLGTDEEFESQSNRVPTTTIIPSIGGIEQSITPPGSGLSTTTGQSGVESRPQLPSPVDILEE